MGRSILAVISMCSLAVSAVASPPTLVADLNTTPTNGSFSPKRAPWVDGSSVPSGYAILYSDQVNDVYLTDGTSLGMRRVIGIPDGWRLTSVARNQAGRVVLLLIGPSSSSALFALDAQAARAVPILDLVDGQRPYPVGDHFVFVNNDASTGRELWVISGDPADPHAQLLLELAPGVADANPTPQTSSGNRLYFTATDATSGLPVLWRSDGTVAGTQVVGPIEPTRPAAGIQKAVALGDGLLYIVQEEQALRFHPYFTDGQTPSAGPLTTFDGATIAMDGYTGQYQFMPVGNRVLFTASDTQLHLYITDGTSQGTRAIAEATAPYSGTTFAVLQDLSAPFGWRTVYSGGTGAEPVVTDGTRAGTSVIADLNVGPDSSNPSGYFTLGNRVYFQTTGLGSNPSYVGGLFSTDGTGAGTDQLAPNDGVPSFPTVIGGANGRVLVSGRDDRGRELWSLNPATEQLSFVADLLGETASGSPQLRSATADVAILNVNTPPFTMVLTDGTPQGTRVFDLGPGSAVGWATLPCSPLIGEFEGLFLMYANSAATGDEPFLLDPNTGQFMLYQDLHPGSVGSSPLQGCYGSFQTVQLATSGRAVFTTPHIPKSPPVIPTPSYTLWSTAGVPGDALRLADFRSLSNSIQFNFVKLNDRAYFFAPRPPAEPSSFVADLWTTDGTVAGTSRVASLPSLGITAAYTLTPLNGRLYISAYHAASSQTRLFDSDGTADGTRLLALTPEFDADRIASVISTSIGLLISTISTTDDQTTNWVTDGTPEGTFQLTPPGPSNPGSGLATAVDGGGRAFFVRFTPDLGTELWVTDGTPAGTHVATDLVPGTASSYPAGLVGLGQGRALFAATTAALGTELWQSDGTPFGTRPLADLNPGPGSITVQPLTTIRNRVLLTLDDGSPIGRELWQWTITPPCRCDIDNSGGTSVQDIFEFLWLYFSGRGDFNGDGATGVQDIFDFLGCWFVGCD